MPVVQWDETLSVGVQEIDAQHRGLLALINELHEAIAAGRSRGLLGEVVNRLKDYARTHFSTEEKYMLQTAFPGFDEHRMAHDLFIEKVLGFELDLHRDRASPREVAGFLMDWYVRHVKGMDHQYAGHFRKHGIR